MERFRSFVWLANLWMNFEAVIETVAPKAPKLHISPLEIDENSVLLDVLPQKNIPIERI